LNRIAVFASGSGTNLQNLIDHARRDALGGARIVLVVSDRPESKAVERARRAGIPVLAADPRTYASKSAYEAEILSRLREHRVDWIVLAGYMRLLGPTLLQPYEGRIINIHPSLLPLFPGKDAIRQALEAGVKYTGVTVHFVDEGMDTGPVIRQQSVWLDPGDTYETLAQKVHQVEYRLLPEVVRWLVEGKIRLEGRNVIKLAQEETDETSAY
jgi:phosphoribosylglycinamide formyltransferase-1